MRTRPAVWSPTWLRACWVISVVFTLFLSATSARQVAAQDASAAQEKHYAERFLQVLLRRPRPGTALDRVYGYHLQAGSLDSLLADLNQTAAAGGADAGAHYMLIGLLQLQRGQDAQAVASLEKAEPLLADDAMASYYLGKALLLAGRTEAAAAALERSIERTPPRNEALMVYKELGRLYQRGEQNEKALSVWNRLEAAFPGDARVSEEIAATLTQEGELEEALQRYQQLAKTSASDADYRAVGYQVAAAELKRELGQQDEALAELESILARLRPGSWLHADVRQRIEAGFLRTGDYAALADYYAKQAQQNPDDVDTQLRLGRALAKAGRLSEAIEALQSTVARAPDHEEVRLTLIDVFVMAGKYAQAAKQYEALAQLDGENPDYLVGWGNVLLDDKTRDLPQRQTAAAAVWQRLAAARRDDPVITSQVADLMRKIDHTQQAIELYQRSIELAPTQSQYREYLGEYLYRLGRQDEALKVWESIAAGDRKNRETLIRLAEVLTVFQYDDQALDVFAEAAAMDPSFAQQMRYVELLSRAQRYETSLSQLNQAEQIAETPEEHEQVLQARIGVYSSSGTLNDKIAETEEMIAHDTSNAEAYRKLALMLDAAARSSEAMAAAQKAVELAPQDPAALSVAAELYRKSSRYADAVATYHQLAELDTRFLSNYLQRIAGLQMRLGKIEQALATGQELIAAQPGNPESYRFYADLCFQSSRDEEGIDTLRRALRTAPRESSLRDTLARVLADRFRTEEAIELYWQSLDETQEFEDQKRLVSALALLYARKGEFARLIAGLEELGREASDRRLSALLISEAHKATNDFGAALQTLEPLLDENPRDTDLLSQMVALSSAADYLEAAVHYQQRRTKLADTPENQRLLMTLLIDAGEMDQIEASLRLMKDAGDPATMVKLIDRTINRNDNEAAIRLCRAALQQRPDLWEITTRLAALLVREGQHEEAIKVAQQIEDLNLDAAEWAASKSTPKPTATGVASNQTAAAAYATHRGSYSQNGYQLAAFFKLGRYANVSYSLRRSQALDVNTYGQARFAALAIRLAAATKLGNLEEAVAPIIDDEIVRTGTDVNQLWRAREARLLRDTFRGATATTPTPSPSFSGSDLDWRLAELDANNATTLIYSLLASRSSVRTRMKDQVTAATTDNAPLVKPLTEPQLELVLKLHQQTNNATQPVVRIPAHWVYEELMQAGKQQQAAAIKESVDLRPDTIDDTRATLQFCVSIGDQESIEQVLDHVNDSFSDWLATSPAAELSSLMAATAAAATEAIPDFRSQAVDMMIAREAAETAAATARWRGRSATRTGTLGVQYLLNGQYQTHTLSTPFSDSLLPDDFVRSFYQNFKFGIDSPERDELLEHLSKEIALADPKSDAFAVETKLRRTLLAYATWWAGDVDAAYRKIAALSGAYPEDYNLCLEHARLAAQLNRLGESLETLDSINPLDQATLRTRELAAMNLASQLGRLDRAKLAARRLFGMRLDTRTELALASQLSRLGMNDMATAVLQRSQRRGGQTPAALLEIGQQYLDAKHPEAAAEVAYAALRKLNRGTSRNDATYRQRAANILKQVGRLDALVEQAEQRAESAPNSTRLQMQLAEIYKAAGRQDDAAKLLEKLTVKIPRDPGTMISTAKQLVAAGNQAKAVDLYLAAFKKDPSLLRQEYYNFERAVVACKRFDDAFAEMSTWDLSNVDGYSLGRILNLPRRARSSKPSEQALAFVNHVLKSTAPNSLNDVLRYVHQVKGVATSKELAAAMLRIFTIDETYAPGNSLWTRVSRSSGGVAIGPLQPCLEALAANEDVRDQVIKMLQQRVRNETWRAVAEPMLAAIRLPLVEQSETVATIDALLEKADRNTPFALWWQFGQILEEDKELQDLAIRVLEHVQTYPEAVSVGGSYPYGINTKLANSYLRAGQTEKARQQLLADYENVDHSRENQYNAGYGDYSELRAYQAIAKQLIAADAPLDAMRIYADALSHPEKIAAAKRYSGSRDYAETFSKELEEATKSLTSDHYRKFLTQIADEPESDHGKPIIDLYPLAATSETKAEDASVAAMVVYELAKTDDGMQLLEQTQSRLAELRKSWGDDWSLVALQAMIAIAAEMPTATAHMEELYRMAVAAVGDGATPMQPQAKPMLTLYSPVLMAFKSDDAAVRQHASELSATLLRLAKAQNQKSLVRLLVLSRVRANDTPQGSAEMNAAMMELLDGTSPTSDARQIATSDFAKDCLEIAELALEEGADDVVAEAVQRAFGGGPPLLILNNQGTSNPAGFITLGTSVTTSSSRQPLKDADLVQLSHRVFLLAEQMRTRPKGNGRVYEMLSKVVMPPTRDAELFPYVQPVVGANAKDPFANDGKLQLQSLSQTLVDAAVACGKADELLSAIQARRSAIGNPLPPDLIIVQHAIATKDQDSVIQTLSQMAEWVGIPTDPNAEDNSTPNPQMPASIIDVTNTLMHATLPAVGPTDNHEVTVAIRKALLGWSSSNRELAAAKGLWQKITADLNKDSSLSSRSRRSVMSAMLNAVKKQYSSHSDSYREQKTEEQRFKLAESMLEAKDWALAGELLRSKVVKADGIKKHDQVQSLIPIAMKIQAAPPAQRYKMLATMMFGIDGQAPLHDWTGFILYARPPEELLPLTPNLRVVQGLPLTQADMPLLSVSQLIAVAAAESGNTEELIARLAAHVKEPGDNVEAMIGLAKLAGGDHAGAVEILTRVAKQLKETRPQDNGDEPVPVAAGLLAAGCLAIEGTGELAVAALTDLLHHVRRSKTTYARTFFSRVLAKNGGSLAAGAETGSPLEHFASVQLPYTTRPESPNTEPVYVIRDGTVRFAGGSDQNLLLFKYPLQGDFTFRYRNIHHGWGDSGLSYGGVVFKAASWDDSLSAIGLVSRDLAKFPCHVYDKQGPTDLQLQFAGDSVQVKVNDQTIITDDRTKAMPFVAAYMIGMDICELAKLTITGNPTIPREVKLIDDRLPGWSCQIYRGRLPNLDLPIAPDEDPAAAEASRRSTPAMEATRRTWYADKGVLKTGNRSLNVFGMEQLQYLRPLCAGESINYQFYYQPGVQEVHPTLGRTAILLRPDGVKLRWLVHQGSAESIGVDPLHEVEPANLLPDHGKYQLQANAWNDIQLTADQAGVTLHVNGSEICYVGSGRQQKFGVLDERQRACQIRDLTLKGPWPESVPSELMQVAR